MRFTEYRNALPDHVIAHVTEGVKNEHREKVLDSLFKYGQDYVTAISEDAFFDRGTRSVSDQHLKKLRASIVGIYPGGKQALQLTPGISIRGDSLGYSIESFVFFKTSDQIRAFIESRLSEDKGYDTRIPLEERKYATEDLQAFAQGISCGYLMIGNVESAVEIAFLGTNGDLGHATRMKPVIDSMHPNQSHLFNTKFRNIAKNPENQAVQSWQV